MILHAYGLTWRIQLEETKANLLLLIFFTEFGESNTFYT